MRNIIPKNARLVPEEAKLVFKGVIYDVYQWEQKMFDGTFLTFEMLKRPDTIKVIAIKDNKTVITRQNQPNSKEFLDVPGGMHDIQDEDELSAAKRELEEETGLVCKNWKLVSVKQPHNKIEQFVYVFIAWNVIEEKTQKLDNSEKISVELMNFDVFKNMLGTDEFRSPKMDFLENINSVEELLTIPEYKI